MNTFRIAFSPREVEVLDLLAQWNVKDEQIAKILHMSKGNAHNYVNRIMRLTGIHDRTMLVRYAQENGYGKKQSLRITEALSPSMLTTQKLETEH